MTAGLGVRCGLLAAWIAASTIVQADPPNFEVMPLDLVLSGTCLDEDIWITGNEYLSFHQVEDSSGGLHFWFRFAFQGDARGWGLRSGAEYKLVGAGGGGEHYRSDLESEVITRQVRFSFIGNGPANNVQAFETTNIKMNRHGEVKVEITEAGFECQGSNPVKSAEPESTEAPEVP